METAQDNRIMLRTAAGVEVGVTIAGLGGRSFAFLIDWHIRLLLALTWLLAAGIILGGGELRGEWMESDELGLGFYLAVLPPLLIYLFYHPVLEIAMQGRTPGKRMAGIRIVDRSGHTPTVGALLLRNVLRLVDSLPAYYLLGIGVVLASRDTVRIGDMAAGTVLVYEERPKLDVLAQHNPRLHPLWQEMLADLLERWRTLDPNVRTELAERLLAGAGREIPQGKGKENSDLRLRVALSQLLNGEH